MSRNNKDNNTSDESLGIKRKRKREAEAKDEGEDEDSSTQDYGMKNDSASIETREHKMIPCFALIFANGDTQSLQLFRDNCTRGDLWNLSYFLGEPNASGRVFPEAKAVIDSYIAEKRLEEPKISEPSVVSSSNAADVRKDIGAYLSSGSSWQRKREVMLSPPELKKAILGRLTCRQALRKAQQERGEFYSSIKLACEEEWDLKVAAAMLDGLEKNQNESLVTQLLKEFLLLMSGFSPENRSKQMLKFAKCKMNSRNILYNIALQNPTSPRASVTTSPTSTPKRDAALQPTDGYLGSSSSSSSLDTREQSNFSLGDPAHIFKEECAADVLSMFAQASRSSPRSSAQPSALSSPTSSSLLATISRSNQKNAALPTLTEKPGKK